MRRLVEVEEAVAVMTEGAEWSVMKWLSQKKRVRKIADRANAALDAAEAEVKRGWSDEVHRAYRAVNGNGLAKDVAAAVRRAKQADDVARRAHVDAEAAFDEAEKQMSARLAREGCGKAILSWELHEKAIRHAEELGGKAGE